MPSISEQPELELSNVREVNKSSFNFWGRREISDSWKGMDYFFIAEEGEEIVGYTSIKELNLGEPVGFIGWIAVKPEFRNRGIATKLVERALDYFRKKELGIVYITTKKKNKEALEMFENVGFEKVSALKVLREYNTLKVLRFYFHTLRPFKGTILAYELKN